MSRRPGPDFGRSNGHGRSAFLAMPRPMVSNLVFTASNGESPADLRRKFLEACKQNGQQFGLLVREMDNPVLASTSQEELSESLETLATGAANGDRMPLLVYKVYVNDGHEELVRGAVFSELDVRALRSDLSAAGNDPLVTNRLGGLGTTVICPSLLFDELQVKRADTSKDKLPDYPAPPLSKK